MDKIYQQGMPAQETEKTDKRGIVITDYFSAIWVQKISKEQANQCYTEPGKNRKIIKCIEMLWHESKPHQP